MTHHCKLPAADAQGHVLAPRVPAPSAEDVGQVAADARLGDLVDLYIYTYNCINNNKHSILAMIHVMSCNSKNVILEYFNNVILKHIVEHHHLQLALAEDGVRDEVSVLPLPHLPLQAGVLLLQGESLLYYYYYSTLNIISYDVML